MKKVYTIYFRGYLDSLMSSLNSITHVSGQFSKHDVKGIAKELKKLNVENYLFYHKLEYQYLIFKDLFINGEIINYYWD